MTDIQLWYLFAFLVGSLTGMGMILRLRREWNRETMNFVLDYLCDHGYLLYEEDALGDRNLVKLTKHGEKK